MFESRAIERELFKSPIADSSDMSKSEQADHKQLVFVTHNNGKIESANKYFGGKVCYKALDCEVPEIRGTLEEIAIAKVMSAYDITNKPTIAVDAGFVIEDLKGYPGPYVNYTLSTIGIDGILRLMEGSDKRECRFVQCLAYYDGVGEPKVFQGVHEGTMAPEKRGVLSNDDWSELSLIFVPKEELDTGRRTLAELSHEERIVLAKKNDACSAFARFRDWYLENYSIT